MELICGLVFILAAILFIKLFEKLPLKASVFLSSIWLMGNFLIYVIADNGFDTDGLLNVFTGIIIRIAVLCDAAVVIRVAGIIKRRIFGTSEYIKKESSLRLRKEILYLAEGKIAALGSLVNDIDHITAGLENTVFTASLTDEYTGKKELAAAFDKASAEITGLKNKYPDLNIPNTVSGLSELRRDAESRLQLYSSYVQNIDTFPLDKLLLIKGDVQDT